MLERRAVDWSRESVLVTGGQGFVGSHLVASLLKNGADVVVPIRRISMLPRCGFDRLEMRLGDVRDKDFCLDLLRSHHITMVFHFAGCAIVKDCQSLPQTCFENNIKGTWTLLEACRTINGGDGAGPINAIVVASTDKVYGEQRTPYQEDDSLLAEGVYDTSKLCLDRIAYMYRSVFGLPITIPRFCNIYGYDTNFRVIPNTISRILSGRPPLIFSGMGDVPGDEMFVREYIYVDDAVEAILCLATHARNENSQSVFNVGSGFTATTSEVVTRILEICQEMELCAGDMEPEYRKRAPSIKEILKQSLDSTRIRSLGWTPRFAFDEAIRLVVRMYSSGLRSGSLASHNLFPGLSVTNVG